MSSFKNKDLLKNKFQGIEMSLEDVEFNYKIHPEKIEKIKTVEQRKMSFSIFYINLFFRGFKVVSKVIIEAINTVVKKKIMSLSLKLMKSIFFIASKANQYKIEKEVLIDEFLTRAEAELEVKKETSELMSQHLDEKCNLIKKDFVSSFNVKSVDVLFHCDSSELEKARSGLEFDLSIFEKISQKLTKTNMITNISHLNIDLYLEKKYIKFKIEFKLKFLGEKWAKMFSKHISSKIFLDVKNYKGAVKNSLIQKISPRREVFILTFSHQRLDIFLDKEKSDEINFNTNINKKSSLLDL